MEVHRLTLRRAGECRTVFVHLFSVLAFTCRDPLVVHNIEEFICHGNGLRHHVLQVDRSRQPDVAPHPCVQPDTVWPPLQEDNTTEHTVFQLLYPEAVQQVQQALVNGPF